MSDKNNQILVVKSNVYLKPNDKLALHDDICKQRETGVIVLPAYVEALIVPEDVKIEVETH